MNNERDDLRIRRTPGEIKSSSSPPHVHSNHSELDLSDAGGAMGSGEVERREGAEMTEAAMHNGSLRGDRSSVALLIALYILQGIPLGLSASIPYLLQSRKVRHILMVVVSSHLIHLKNYPYNIYIARYSTSIASPYFCCFQILNRNTNFTDVFYIIFPYVLHSLVVMCDSFISQSRPARIRWYSELIDQICLNY